jgi:hypothetical protein
VQTDTMTRRRRVGLLLAAVTVGAIAAPAPAAADVRLAGGTTALTLDAGVARALSGAGIAVSPIRPAAVRGGAVAFPITGGRIDPATAAGTIEHSGGLRIAAGRTVVRLTRFTVRVGRTSTLTASVGNARVPILRLDTSRARITRSGLATNVAGVRALLTAQAARALNTAFDTHLFRGGLAIGSVRVNAQPAEIELTGGATTLAVDAGAASALQSLGVTPAPIAPATAGQPGLRFPISGGTVNARTLAGEITHRGGISLTRGGTVVRLTDFTIAVDRTPSLSAEVGGSRVEILSLDLAGARTRVAGRNVTVSGVVAKLTGAAAGALNQAFGTTAFQEGLTLGTATVRARAA